MFCKKCSIVVTIMDFPGGSDGKVSVYNAGDLGSIPGSGRSPGEGNGNPLLYSCLENPMDGGAWWATWGHKDKDLLYMLLTSDQSSQHSPQLEYFIYGIYDYFPRRLSCMGQKSMYNYCMLMFATEIMPDRKLHKQFLNG